MTALVKIAGAEAARRNASARESTTHDMPTRAAANDESHPPKRDTPENPLWVINIAMAAFFTVAALVMMTS